MLYRSNTERVLYLSLPTTVGKVQTVPMPEAADEDDALLARMERRFDVVNGGKE